MTDPQTAPAWEQADESETASAEALADLAGVDADTGEAIEDRPAPVPTIPTAELVRPALDLVCASIAPAWEITKEEKAALSDAYAAVLDKYFPDGIAAGPEVAAIIITAGVIGPRLGKPRKAEAAPAPGQGEGREGAAPPGDFADLKSVEVAPSV